MKNNFIFFTAAFALVFMNLLGGMANAQSGSIQGIAFVDINGSGIFDMGDFVPTWAKIELTGPVSASVFLDYSGNYSFSELPAGTYTVKAADSAGLTIIVPASGQYGQYTIVLSEGESSTGNDFVWFGLGDVNGIVYDDANSNRLRDEGEIGLKGRSLRIDNATDPPTWSNLYSVTMHVRNGNWKQKIAFGIHPLATYGIDKSLGEYDEWWPERSCEVARFVDIPSYIGALGNGTYEDYRPSVSSDQADTFKIEYISTPSEGTEIEFSWPEGLSDILESCQLVNLLESPTINVDMLTSTMATMTTTSTDSIYIIAKRKPSWTGVHRYTITGTNYIYPCQWIPHPDGFFEFRNLMPGTYRLSLLTNTGWETQEVTPGNYLIPVVSSGTIFNYIIAVAHKGAATGSISGTYFEDINGDGVRWSDEPGLANKKIWLSGSKVDSTLTDYLGNFIFNGLTAGTYTLSIVTEDVWIQTCPNTKTYTVALTDYGSAINKDFGIFAQTKYRTFNQFDLSEQKEKQVGKVGSSWQYFIFHNTLPDTIYALHIRFSVQPLVFNITHDMREQSPWYDSINVGTIGDPVLPGDSVMFYVFVQNNKLKKITVKYWWWLDGIPGTDWQHQTLDKLGDIQPGMGPSGMFKAYIQPNGGNVRDYIYKNAVKRPDGVVIGIPQSIPDSAKVHGWVRFKSASKKYFPHNGLSRCFDLIVNGQGGSKKFVKELKNPHVNKHDNVLLGELHALKLAMIANAYGVTEPDTPATRLADLIYNDPDNPGDPFNNLTIKQIAYLADSALTYCMNFEPVFYTNVETVIGRINQAFDGAYRAIRFTPLKIAGTNPLPAFLHPNPLALSVILPISSNPDMDNQPDKFFLAQNYPNPFNPTTTIEFNLSEPSIVTLKVYNLLGQEIKVLLNDEIMEDGEQSVEFNADNIPSGIYFYNIIAQGVGEGKQQFQAIKCMILIK